MQRNATRLVIAGHQRRGR